jgi:hypothetical protein
MTQQWCNWCKKSTGIPVLVGIIETGSGPGRFVYACPACRVTYRIKPLFDHDPGGDGRPQYQKPRPVPPPSFPPT